MKNLIYLLVLYVIPFLFSSNSFAQENGKILAKAEADVLFGSIKQSVVMSTSAVDALLSRCDQNIMVGEVNGKIVVTDDKRNVLYPYGATILNTDVLSMYSVSKFKELFAKGGEGLTSIEVRKSTMTITNGAYTLEYGPKCPPYCL